MTLKANGDSLSAGEVQYKTIAIKNLNMYTVKSTGYVYWLAGHIVVNGVEYAVSASNSGASKTDKLIVATLTDGANTAAFTFVATSSTITAANEVLIGYVDASSRLTLFSATAQPNFSGYTFTKATANINVNGEGYLLSAQAFGFSAATGFGSGPTASTQARIQISIDGSSVDDENNSHSHSMSANGATACSFSGAIVPFTMKFNSNLTITFTTSAGTSGGSDATSTSRSTIYYLVK
jgi:hypothetical protein